MKKIDRLLMLAKPKPSGIEKLLQDNKFMAESDDDFLNRLETGIPTPGTKSWKKYIAAAVSRIPGLMKKVGDDDVYTAEAEHTE